MSNNIYPDLARVIFDNLVENGGIATDVTVKTITDSTYNEATADYTKTTTNLTIRAFVSGFKQQRTEELSNFEYERKMLYLYNDYSTPREDDIFTIEGEDYNANMIEIDPAKAVVTILLTKVTFT